jgi:hypothetical protein
LVRLLATGQPAMNAGSALKCSYRRGNARDHRTYLGEGGGGGHRRNAGAITSRRATARFSLKIVLNVR